IIIKSYLCSWSAVLLSLVTCEFLNMSAPVLQFFYDTLFNNKSTIGPTGMYYALINSIYLSFWGHFGETRTFSSPLKDRFSRREFCVFSCLAIYGYKINK